MPVSRKPLQLKTGNSTLDALVQFFSGGSDPAQSAMDVVNPLSPVVGMATRGGSKILNMLKREIAPLEQIVYRDVGRKEGVAPNFLSQWVRDSRKKATGFDRLNDMQAQDLMEYKKQLEFLQSSQKKVSESTYEATRDRVRKSSNIEEGSPLYKAMEAIKKIKSK